MTSHSNLSDASKAFGEIATTQNNAAAAGMAIHLAIASAEAYAAELEERQRQAKDGFTGSLQIGDKLFPESIELGLGDVVTAENIDELTSIFTNESLITAVADSVATALPIDVPIPYASVDAAIGFLRSRFVDVDWDGFPDRVTIFGDDPSVPVSPNGDGYEAHFVLNLVCPKETRFTAIFRKPSGEIVTDSLSYHEPMNEALDAAHEDAHRYGWAFVSLQTVNA
jgi:hypothetical protein